MDNAEKIRRYVKDTGIDRKARTRYDMRERDLRTLLEAAKAAPVETLCLAFTYGMAKGYRAAKAEAIHE